MVSETAVNKEDAQRQLVEMIDTIKLRKFAEDDIFNMDETGLEWRTIYKNGFVLGDPKRIKVSKIRLTALVGRNMTGTMKLPLFIIWKSAQPRNFPMSTQKRYVDQ